MKHFIYILFFLFSVAASMTSCVKEKSFSPIPAIVFVKYVTYGLDSAYCYINFKDGDGDIGTIPGDTSELTLKYLAVNTVGGPFLPYNIKGSFTPIPPSDTLFYNYIVPDLTPAGQNKALDGSIIIKLRTQPLYAPSSLVVKFDIILTDRAGHKSNMVETNAITVTGL